MFKKHAFIVLVFDTETAAQKVIKNKLFIADISVRTVKYEKKTQIFSVKNIKNLNILLIFAKV